MKQPLKISFLLFVLVVLFLSAVFFRGSPAAMAQDGIDENDNPGTPQEDGTSVLNVDPTEASIQESPEEEIIEEQQGASSFGKLDSMLLAQSQIAEATAAAADGYLYALVDYIADASGNKIYGYKADAVSGQLTLLAGFPINTGQLGNNSTVSERMVYDESLKHLYVINDGDATLSAYKVNVSTGQLTELSFSPLSLGAGFHYCVNVHPNGSPLVVGAATSGTLSYNITADSATPAVGSPFLAGAESVVSCTFSQDGQYLYSGGLNNLIGGFSVNSSSGVLTPLSDAPYTSSLLNAWGMAVDSDGRLFHSSWNSGEVAVYYPDSGDLNPASGNPFASGTGSGVDGILHPAGFYMIADRALNQVGVYEISGSGESTTLTPVPGSPFASGGAFTDVLALSRTGAFLYAGNGDDRNITVFKVDVSSGALTSINTLAVNSLGTSLRITGMAFAPVETPPPTLGGFVYSLQDDTAGNYVHGFEVDASSGILTSLSGFPVSVGEQGNTGDATERMFFDQSQSRLFVINSNPSDSVSVYSVNQSTGNIVEESFSPISLDSGNYYCVTVGQGGSPLVVGDLSGEKIYSFHITSTSATAAPGSPYTMTTVNPFSCTFSRNGDYVYAGSASVLNTIAGFSVNSSNGALASITTPPFSSGSPNPVALSTDNSGRLFTAQAVHNEVRAFITNNGVPQQVTGNPFTSGLSTAVDSVVYDDKYLMVADRTGNQIGVYDIGGSGLNTTLLPVAGSPFISGGNSTDVLAESVANNFLFAQNSASRDISTYSVNPGSGVLTGLATQPSGSTGSSGRNTGMVFVDFIRANFTGSPTSGRVNHKVNFTNTSVGPYSSCLWKFGDGIQSTSCGNPSYTYKTVGTFKVTLNVSTPGGGHTKTRNSYVTVTNVVADFTASPTSGPINHTVKFTNKSLGDYTGCSWKFGDGGVSTGCNPTYTYKKPGNYDVTLTISVPGGGDSKKRNGYIKVQNAEIFVSLTLGNVCGGFRGPNEQEPNNDPGSANGLLCLNKTYQGSPDDDHPELESDWFSFYSDGGPFTVQVTKFLNSDAQVLLYYKNSGNLVSFLADQASGSYILPYNGAAGKYLIRVIALAGHIQGNGDYSLKVAK